MKSIFCILKSPDSVWVICAQISLRAMVNDAGQPDVSSAAQSVWLFLYLKPDTREKWREVQFSVFFIITLTHCLSFMQRLRALLQTTAYARLKASALFKSSVPQSSGGAATLPPTILL